MESRRPGGIRSGNSRRPVEEAFSLPSPIPKKHSNFCHGVASAISPVESAMHMAPPSLARGIYAL